MTGVSLTFVLRCFNKIRQSYYFLLESNRYSFSILLYLARQIRPNSSILFSSFRITTNACKCWWVNNNTRWSIDRDLLSSEMAKVELPNITHEDLRQIWWLHFPLLELDTGNRAHLLYLGQYEDSYVKCLFNI